MAEAYVVVAKFFFVVSMPVYVLGRLGYTIHALSPLWGRQKRLSCTAPSALTVFLNLPPPPQEQQMPRTARPRTTRPSETPRPKSRHRPRPGLNQTSASGGYSRPGPNVPKDPFHSRETIMPHPDVRCMSSVYAYSFQPGVCQARYPPSNQL